MKLHIPDIFPVTCHTQHVGPGSTFVAINGFTTNGVQFIPKALQKGATTIVVHKDETIPADILATIDANNAKLERVADTRKALAQLSALAAGVPTNNVTIIGITGTKGKTTTTYLLEHILRASGLRTARITGVENMINGHLLPANLTTPQPDYLHQFFKVCVDNGVTHVVMEVAAQALSLHRVHGIEFDGIIFTNIAREHFEFYQNLDDYLAAKLTIFAQRTPRTLCLVNSDDAQLVTATHDMNYVHYYGLEKKDELTCATHALYNTDVTGTSITAGETIYTCPTLMGAYNASNMLAACIMAERLGIHKTAIQQALLDMPPIPGRMETYMLPHGARAIIDYAHNPSSYRALLSTLRPLTDHLIVVFGASGTRDVGKRPLMGAVAAEYADMIILTADNPGPADPVAIAHDIAHGIPQEHKQKVIIEPDRAKAIYVACAKTHATSIVVLLGKGTDEYQVIGATKHPFSERAIIQNTYKSFTFETKS